MCALNVSNLLLDCDEKYTKSIKFKKVIIIISCACFLLSPANFLLPAISKHKYKHQIYKEKKKKKNAFKNDSKDFTLN